jgi:hypothetical protein
VDDLLKQDLTLSASSSSVKQGIRKAARLFSLAKLFFTFLRQVTKK